MLFFDYALHLIMLHKPLKLMRVFHELTQKELADKLGISKSHLSEIEAGKKTPTIALLNRYAEIFEVPVSSIFLFSENLDNNFSGFNPKKLETVVPSKLLVLMNFIAIHTNRET